MFFSNFIFFKETHILIERRIFMTKKCAKNSKISKSIIQIANFEAIARVALTSAAQTPDSARI